ncbi:hypothetical protein ACFFHM_03285 [Halalkalibacter kiskunsagensis]|uniref:Replication protein n=1 Tax=Halalkalibacter kiskunsagensis TaxID=1548599 RepID=A0ABV6K8I1_9BACI
MCIKGNINQLQKRLLERLNVKTGSTLYLIIQEVSRQAYAKQSYSVSQKNSTLASKCKVTASTISRNLKKLKEKCADLITIEQNRNTEEKFAALVFTFQCQTVGSNGLQTEQVKDSNEPNEVAESTSSLFSTNLLVHNKNTNTYNTNTVKQDVKQEQIIFDTYIEFSKQGIKKELFNKVVSEVKEKKHVKNFKAYLRGALENVLEYKNNVIEDFTETVYVRPTNWWLDKTGIEY